jgi:ferritin-like metal-binding protein YciE
MNDLEKLFLSELRDIYDGEKQLVDALPEMARSAGSADLKSSFSKHLEETKGHVNRLEEVFRGIGEEPSRKVCKGLEGIIDEGELLAAEFKGNTALDAGLIAAAQKAEHYEITTYGTLCTWANELGNERGLALLKTNLSEEKEADEKLSAIAKSLCNLEAIHHDTEKKGEGISSFEKVVTAGV